MVFQKLLSIKFILLIFIFMSIASIFIRYSTEYEFITDHLIRESFKDNFSETFINKELEYRKRPFKSYFITTPVIKLLKIFLLSTIVFIGFSIFNKFNIGFFHLFRILVLSEIVFILEQLFKFVYLKFVPLELSMKVLMHFEPLALISFYNINNLEFWQIVLFKNVNIVYFFYPLLASFIISKYFKIDFEYVSKIVLCSLSIFLFIYLSLNVLLALNYA